MGAKLTACSLGKAKGCWGELVIFLQLPAQGPSAQPQKGLNPWFGAICRTFQGKTTQAMGDPFL